MKKKKPRDYSIHFGVIKRLNQLPKCKVKSIKCNFNCKKKKKLLK